MMTLVSSKRFERELSSLLKKSPQLKKSVIKTLKNLQKDLNYPSLRLHRLVGLQNYSISGLIEKMCWFFS